MREVGGSILHYPKMSFPSLWLTGCKRTSEGSCKNLQNIMVQSKNTDIRLPRAAVLTVYFIHEIKMWYKIEENVRKFQKYLQFPPLVVAPVLRTFWPRDTTALLFHCFISFGITGPEPKASGWDGLFRADSEHPDIGKSWLECAPFLGTGHLVVIAAYFRNGGWILNKCHLFWKQFVLTFIKSANVA